MSKVIDSIVQSSLDSSELAGVVLVQLHFPTKYRFASAFQNIYWDEGQPSPEAGEQEYIGLGGLASMSVLSETSELAAQTVQLTLSGIPNSAVTDIFSNNYVNKPAYIWYATLDKETYAVEGGPTGPVLLFAGQMDFGNVEFGETATITLNVTSRLADWERPRGGRFNHGYQTKHVDPTDLGFEYVVQLQEKVISWGGVTIGDPGNGEDGFGRGGGRGK